MTATDDTAAGLLADRWQELGDDGHRGLRFLARNPRIRPSRGRWAPGAHDPHLAYYPVREDGDVTAFTWYGTADPDPYGGEGHCPKDLIDRMAEGDRGLDALGADAHYRDYPTYPEALADFARAWAALNPED